MSRSKRKNILSKISVLLVLFVLFNSVQFASAGNNAQSITADNINKDNIEKFDPNSPKGQAVYAYNEFNKANGYQWFVEWNDKIGTPKILSRYSKEEDNGQLSGNPEDIAKQFLSTNSDMFLMKRRLDDMVVTKVDQGLASYHVRFLEIYNGLKVYGAETSVHMGKSGQVELVYNNYKPGINIDVIPTMSEINSVNIAKNYINPIGELRGNVSTELVIYPRDDGNYLAYKVLIPAYEPLGDWLVFVDAKNGNVLGKENLIRKVDGNGAVFDPNPVVTSGDNTIRDNNNADSTLLTGQRINRVLRGLDSTTGKLKGPYVDLTAPGITGAYKPAGQANEATHNYQYTRSDDRFEEVNVYYAIDSYQRYIQSLGFTNVNNRAIPVHAHYYAADNSFYSGGDTGLHFGDGGVDDAEDADIVLHEYGHSIQDNQVPGFGSTNEGGAMGEGFGDYIAADFYANVNNGFQRTCVGDWDATAYSSTNPPCLRRVDGTKHYPEDMTNEVHNDGEIWSASLYNIRNAVGPTIADKIIIESHFYLSPTSNFRDGANAIILADRNIYGGTHETQIRTEFENRGILPRTGDPFGYTYIDSNTPGGPTYNWIDITQTGTQILPNSDDSYVNNIPVGFFFNFYGTDYSDVGITNNGITLPLGGISQYVNQPIGSSGPHNFISPYWDDLTTWQSDTNGVYYKTIGTAPNRMFVIEWYDNHHYYSSTSGVTLEAILYEGTNNIKFQYQDTDFGTVTGAVGGDLPPYNDGGSATIGIEGPDGQGLQYSYNQQLGSGSMVRPGTAILFKFPAMSGANLHLSKNGPASVNNGDEMTYTLYYSNLGGTAAPNTVLEDTLPPGVEFVSASGEGTYDSVSRIVTWRLGTVAPFPEGRGYETITVRVSNVQVGTVLNNAASISTTILETRYDDNDARMSTTITGSNLPPGVGVEPNNGNTGGTISIYWQNPITFTYQSCPTATRVDIRIHINDGGSDITGTMTGGPPVWTYIAAPFYPRHGEATITYTVYGCQQQTITFPIYIDPAGYIYDIATGERINGASVTLQRPDQLGGWENVPTGLAIMQPDTNPLVTGIDGQYQWNVVAGIYRVHVEASGYLSADSIAVNIPPPVTDLHVALTRARLIGDANGDGRITSGDALLYLRYAVGQDISPYHLDPVQDDVTCDDRITSGDALLVLRKAVGQNVNLVCHP